MLVVLFIKTKLSGGFLHPENVLGENMCNPSTETYVPFGLSK
jgi:hypothetical protein